MAEKPPILIPVHDITHVTVSPDPIEGASVRIEVRGQQDIELQFTAEILAKLEAMLARASIEQAKIQPIQ